MAELSVSLGTERFLREIETTANLRHPHILPLHDSGAVRGALYGRTATAYRATVAVPVLALVTVF